MSFLVFLFLILFVLPPILTTLFRWLASYALKRKARQMNDAFARAAGIDPEELRRQQQQQERVAREGGWTTPTPKPKKFERGVGEYVKFNDVTNAETPTSGTPNTQEEYHGRESQIEDATWEDID